MHDIRTLTDVVDAAVARERFLRGRQPVRGPRLGIAALGVYGLVAHSAEPPHAGDWLRVALGATRGEIIGLVFRDAFALVLVGLAIGLGLAFIAGRAVATLLFNTRPTDLLTLACVVGVLGLVGLLASYLPARRALAIDPIAALRAE
jgi:predicted lysophospholipase L1 biosynthesis ABC-type transport system permease subunit